MGSLFFAHRVCCFFSGLQVQGRVPRVASVFGNHDVMKLRAKLKWVDVFKKDGEAGRRPSGDPWLNEEDREVIDKRGTRLEPQIFASAREQLAALEHANVGYRRRDYSPLKLSVAGARPFSSGGKWLPNIYEHLWGFRAMRESAAMVRRPMCEESPEDHQVVLLAHNGPHGLGSEPNSICGKDWPSKKHPAGGDWGDMDTESALHECNRSVPLVVFGHMHEGLTDGSRRTLLVRTHGPTYVNAAVVPRWRSSATPINISTDVMEWAQLRRATGQPIERHFTLIELLRADPNAKWRVGNVEGLWVLHDGSVVERTPLCARDGAARQKSRLRFKFDKLETETDAYVDEMERPSPNVVEGPTTRAGMKRSNPKIEMEGPAQMLTPNRLSQPFRAEARPELPSIVPIKQQTAQERLKKQSTLPIWRRDDPGRALAGGDTYVSPQNMGGYQIRQLSKGTPMQEEHGFTVGGKKSISLGGQHALDLARIVEATPNAPHTDLIMEGDWGDDDGPPAGWPLFHQIQRGAACGAGLAGGSTDSEGEAPGDLQQASWVARMKRSFNAWWATLPLFNSQTIGHCLGALGLHLFSRFDPALQAWRALHGTPPLSSDKVARGAAEPGCQWYEHSAFDLHDASPEFPAIPSEPDAFKVPLLPIPKLLPDFRRQQSFIQSLDESKKRHNAQALQEGHWKPSLHSIRWATVSSGIFASMGAMVMATLLRHLAKRQNSQAMRDGLRTARRHFNHGARGVA